MIGPIEITVKVCDECEYRTPSRCQHPEAPEGSGGLLAQMRGHTLTPVWCPVSEKSETTTPG
jgi:hypothetical protein